MSRVLRMVPAGRGAAADPAARTPLPGEADEWYREGVRFSCTCSGRCCTVRGEYAYVFVTHDEERALAAALGLPVREFRRRHTFRPAAGQRSLSFEDGRCTFLQGNRCSVYEARPRQCRTWPFWPENMDPRVWEEEVASFCPGVGRGRLYTAEEIRAVLDGRAEVHDGPARNLSK